MHFDLSRFRDTFFQEAEEHIEHMESGFLRLEQGDRDPELLNEIFRSAHSIKGASGMVGFDDLGHFTHELESLLDQGREGTLDPTRVAGLLIQSLDVLKDLLEAARNGQPPPARATEVAALLAAARNGGVDSQLAPAVAGGEEARAQATWSIRFQPAPELFEQGMDPVLVLRELSAFGNLHELRADVSGLPALPFLDPHRCYLAWSFKLTTDKSVDEIRDVFAFVEDGAVLNIDQAQVEDPQPVARQGPLLELVSTAPAEAVQKAVRESSSIRVSTERVDKIIDLVGELVISQSMAAQILQNFTAAQLTNLQEAFAEVDRNTRELQERVMGMRMMPVGSVYSRFPRLVRDLSATTGKQIKLELSGEETELDKGVIESLSDPLTHIIRNSADHGLEGPDERKRAGKPEQGTIRLHTYYQGGSVLVEIADDGRGLNAERIRQKAIDRGMIADDAQLSPDETYELIFAPGFSTAEQVTDLSGRGVGMDVVRRNIQSLNGSVGVTSTPGKGTRVRIKLPLTLAILEGLLLRVGAQVYIVPLTSILESIRPKASQLNAMAGTGEVVVVRSEPIPLVRLHQLFGVETDITDPTAGLIVLVENQGRRVALMVDELLGQQQVVVKSLETNFHKVDGVTGATILGDGQAALILDVTRLTQIEKNISVAA